MTANKLREPVLDALEVIACTAARSACAAEEDGTDVYMAMSDLSHLMPSTALVNAQLLAVAKVAWEAEEQANDDWSGVHEAIATAYRVIVEETARAEIRQSVEMQIEAALAV